MKMNIKVSKTIGDEYKKRFFTKLHGLSSHYKIKGIEVKTLDGNEFMELYNILGEGNRNKENMVMFDWYRYMITDMMRGLYQLKQREANEELLRLVKSDKWSDIRKLYNIIEYINIILKE